MTPITLTDEITTSTGFTGYVVDVRVFDDSVTFLYIAQDDDGHIFDATEDEIVSVNGMAVQRVHG